MKAILYYKTIILILLTSGYVRSQNILVIKKENCKVSITENIKQVENGEFNLLFYPEKSISTVVVTPTPVVTSTPVIASTPGKAAKIISIMLDNTRINIPDPGSDSIIEVKIDLSKHRYINNTQYKLSIKFQDCYKEFTHFFNSIQTENKNEENYQCEINRTFENAFREDVRNYSKGKEVILYDFQNDVNERAMYRIFRKKDQLIVKPITWSKYYLWANQDVEFKIIHLNRFIFDVKFSDSTTTFASTPPPLFNEFFIGSKDGILGKLISSYTLAMVPTGTTAPNPEDAFIENLKIFMNGYNELHDRVTKAYDQCNCFDKCISINYLPLANSLLETKIGLASMQSIWSDQVDTLENKEMFVNECDLNTAATNALDKQIKTLNDIAKRTEAEEKKLSSLKEERQKITLCLTADYTNAKKAILALKNELKPYSALVELQKNLPTEADLKKLVNFVNGITDFNQTYSSGPIQLSGNELNITLNIQTNDSVVKRFGRPTQSTGNRPYNIPILGRGFGSFSSGVFIAPDPNLQNKEYIWKERQNSAGIIAGGDSAHYVLTESGYSLPPLGFAAFGHIQCMVAKNIGLGISPGVGLTIESAPRLVYLLGGSLMLGRERQFVFTTGIAAMQVKVLSNNLKPYVENNTNLVKTTPAITYYKEMKFGVFFSISFTPFTVIKNKK